MNKVKYLFLLILCIGLLGSALKLSAQTSNDKILVTGKKPLKQSDINGLIEFYEWAFETKFTDNQRERFQDYTVNEYRANVASSRQTIDDITNTLSQLLSAANDAQQETRKNFLAAFLPDARKDESENAQTSMSIYDAAHENSQANLATTANSSLEVEESSESNPTSGNSDINISQLIGKWVWGRSGSTTYATGGAMLGSNGSRFTYQFLPNSTVEFTGIMNVMTGGCNLQVFTIKKGKVTFSGETMTINWSPASFSRDDSCSPAKNYKKTLPAETETLKISFRNSYGQKQLCTGTSKNETCFSPTK